MRRASLRLEAAQAHEKEVLATVDRELGAIARPSRVHFVQMLPKTRSGKLLRRSIQALAEGRDPGDLTTLEDPTALEQIRVVIGAAKVSEQKKSAGDPRFSWKSVTDYFFRGSCEASTYSIGSLIGPWPISCTITSVSAQVKCGTFASVV
jgi:hypothetical protein